jgi:hypothetical protein
MLCMERAYMHKEDIGEEIENKFIWRKYNIVF